uniref:Uncharacterized protein n=1 Tax=Entomoneis paludosa TaxID=265537 RepID=A0A7S2YRT8_9STRA
MRIIPLRMLQRSFKRRSFVVDDGDPSNSESSSSTFLTNSCETKAPKNKLTDLPLAKAPVTHQSTTRERRVRFHRHIQVIQDDATHTIKPSELWYTMGDFHTCRTECREVMLEVDQAETPLDDGYDFKELLLLLYQACQSSLNERHLSRLVERQAAKIRDQQAKERLELCFVGITSQKYRRDVKMREKNFLIESMTFKGAYCIRLQAGEKKRRNGSVSFPRH